MSLSTLSYTPAQADAKDIASKIGYAHQLADFDGSELGTPDEYVQLPFLGEHTMPESWSKRTEEYWDADTYLLGVSKEATATHTYVSRRKAVMQDMKELMEDNIYLMLIELTNKPLNGQYQLLGYLAELTNPPEIGKSPRVPFEFQVGFATADITIDLGIIQDGGELGELAITLPYEAGVSTTNLDIAKGQPFGIIEIPWP